MKEEHGKQPKTEGLMLTPVGVLGWILMGLLGLLLVYMVFKFLIPKVAYS
jgi:hypothetical protein